MKVLLYTALNPTGESTPLHCIKSDRRRSLEEGKLQHYYATRCEKAEVSCSGRGRHNRYRATLGNQDTSSESCVDVLVTPWHWPGGGGGGAGAKAVKLRTPYRLANQHSQQPHCRAVYPAGIRDMASCKNASLSWIYAKATTARPSWPQLRTDRSVRPSISLRKLPGASTDLLGSTKNVLLYTLDILRGWSRSLAYHFEIFNFSATVKKHSRRTR